MTDPLSALAANIGGLFLFVLFAAALGLAVFWPLMAFRAVRNLRGIQRELERLNGHMEHFNVEAAPGNTFTRTGPLSIR